MPGQALSYKIGAMKIQALRAKYTRQRGSAFNLASFHDAIRMDGSLPLDVPERQMDAWALQQKNKVISQGQYLRGISFTLR